MVFSDCSRRHHRRIGVPKGLLQHITLGILKQKPMAGSELVEAIEYYTDWKPSPGSIYPLLGKLQEQGLIEVAKSNDTTLKRYTLTRTGIEAVKEEKNHRQNLRSRYHSIQKIYWKLCESMPEDLFDAQSKLLEAIERVHTLVRNKPEASSKIQILLKETAEEIDKMKIRLEREK
jgi:DNA-binding PadR family transcriptional regulator